MHQLLAAESQLATSWVASSDKVVQKPLPLLSCDDCSNSHPRCADMVTPLLILTTVGPGTSNGPMPSTEQTEQTQRQEQAGYREVMTHVFAEQCKSAGRARCWNAWVPALVAGLQILVPAVVAVSVPSVREAM